MAEQHRLTQDPIYYITAGFFAILTTTLPAILGQPRFLPFAQTLALTAFLLVPLRRQDVRAAMLIMTIWMVLQVLVVSVLASLTFVNVERAIPDGFALRGQILAWYFGAESYHPATTAVVSGRRLLELAGVTLGSALSAGIVGIWFLMSATNRAAFESGVVLGEADGLFQQLLAVMPWNLLRLAGYACAVLIFAQFLMKDILAFVSTIREQRDLVLAATILILLGILAEFALPGVWQRLVVPAA